MNSANPKQLRVVAIGGGTGLSTLLRGFKRYVATPGAPNSIDRRARPAPAAPCNDYPCLIRELSAVVQPAAHGEERLTVELRVVNSSVIGPDVFVCVCCIEIAVRIVLGRWRMSAR